MKNTITDLSDLSTVLTPAQLADLEAAASVFVQRERKPRWARARVITRPTKRQRLAARRPHRRMQHEARLSRLECV